MPAQTIAALAGRRIDAPGAAARFPLGNVARVRERIAAVLREQRVTALVASAACGADLAGLDVAAGLGLRRRIVLPFPVAEFRVKSVTDRPGDWGGLFDRLVADAQASGDLVVIDPVGGVDDAAYMAATEVIIGQAEELAEQHHAGRVAITVWDGAPRPGTDLTDAFRDLTAQAGFAPVTVLTS
jgi:hypothetical protein